MQLKRALFLDRDGVINIDHTYVHRQENFEFVDGIFDLCTRAKQLGYLLIVITNQAGIGRGYYTEDDFEKLTLWMRSVFAQRQVPIDAVYYCPYHPEHGIDHYRRESQFRKPAPGMILQAAKEFLIDLQASVLVGDKLSDMEAGAAAGVIVNLLYRPEAVESRTNDDGYRVIRSLAEAIGHLTLRRLCTDPENSGDDQQCPQPESWK